MNKKSYLQDGNICHTESSKVGYVILDVKFNNSIGKSLIIFKDKVFSIDDYNKELVNLKDSRYSIKSVYFTAVSELCGWHTAE